MFQELRDARIFADEKDFLQFAATVAANHFKRHYRAP